LILIRVEFITIFFLPGSGSTFLKVDPDSTKWYGSETLNYTIVISVVWPLLTQIKPRVAMKFPRLTFLTKPWLKKRSLDVINWLRKMSLDVLYIRIVEQNYSFRNLRFSISSWRGRLGDITNHHVGNGFW